MLALKLLSLSRFSFGLALTFGSVMDDFLIFFLVLGLASFLSARFADTAVWLTSFRSVRFADVDVGVPDRSISNH